MTQQSHFWIFIKENENTYPKTGTHHPVYCSITYNSQDMEAT